MSNAANAADAGARTVLASDQVEVVRHYAEAVINAAVSENAAEAVLDDLEGIEGEVLRAFPDFARILGSAQVSQAEKDRILLSVFGERVTDLTLRFLRVLNRHGRLGILGPLAREARQIWDRRHGRVPVFVSVASPLDEGQESALRERVAKLIAATPILHVSTDSSLIGGLVIQVGDKVFDASVRNRLEQLRQRLIEGKTHEIQSRRDQFSHPA